MRPIKLIFFLLCLAPNVHALLIGDEFNFDIKYEIDFFGNCNTSCFTFLSSGVSTATDDVDVIVTWTTSPVFLFASITVSIDVADDTITFFGGGGLSIFGDIVFEVSDLDWVDQPNKVISGIEFLGDTDGLTEPNVEFTHDSVILNPLEASDWLEDGTITMRLITSEIEPSEHEVPMAPVVILFVAGGILGVAGIRGAARP